MRQTEFLQRFVNDLRQILPKEYKTFETRSFGSLVKVYYGNPRIHYELWLRSNGIMEIGLHFEADKETNDRLLRYFSNHALEVIEKLGPHVEAEQWTKSWGRVHQTVLYSVADDRLLSLAVERMVDMITVLQPLLEEA